MERNQANRSWQLKAFVFSLATTLAGSLAGLVLGAVGGFLSSNLRIVTGSLLALVAVVVGGLAIVGHAPPILQRDRETPQRWIHYGALQWAAWNGFSLGLGVLSRLGFWLWYVIPFGALLVGRPDLGAILYGTYGTVRGGMVWIILLGHWLGHNGIEEWMLKQKRWAQLITGIQLTVLGVALAVIVGI